MLHESLQVLLTHKQLLPDNTLLLFHTRVCAAWRTGNRGPVPVPLYGKSPSSLQHTLTTETAGQILLPWPPAPFKYHGGWWTRTEASRRNPSLGKLRTAPLEGKWHPQTETSPTVQVSSLPFCVMAGLDSFSDRSPLSIPHTLTLESLLHQSDGVILIPQTLGTDGSSPGGWADN